MNSGETMPTALEQQLDDMLFDCCQQLFAAYHLEVTPHSAGEVPFPDTLAVAGVMGFGGKQMRGAVVLAATDGPLMATNPTQSASQRDWICELANQLVGRMKLRLLALGVEILLATPAGLTGVSLSPLAARPRGLKVFSAGSGLICAWVDCEKVVGFEAQSTPPLPTEAAVTEGELLLF